MSAAKYCPSALGFNDSPKDSVDKFYPISEISMLGTAKYNQDFVAAQVVKRKSGLYFQVVIKSTNGVCGPWKWKADLTDPAWISRSDWSVARLYYHKDAPADWYQYWIIWMDENLEGYMVGFVDLKRLTTKWNQLANKFAAAVFVR
jgi:hypothetical protein